MSELTGIDQLQEDLNTYKATLIALGEVTKKLIICARTTGGVAGPDEGLMAACEAAENTITLVGVSRAIDAFEAIKAENEALIEALEKLVNLDQRCGWHSKEQDAAIKAIAKARGEA